MIHILVSANADLASSFAIRFAGQLAKFIEVGIQPVHVKEREHRGQSPGTGWARRTWERALLEKAEKEINQLVKAEKMGCPALAAPRVVIGDREEEILRELQEGVYDLFMEGFLASFNEADFHKLIRSRLYRNLPCPVVVVKDLVPLEKGALILGEGIDSRSLIRDFLKVFKGTKLELDLLLWKFERSASLKFLEKGEPDLSLLEAEKMMEDGGWIPNQGKVAVGPPEKLSEYLWDYALVGSSIRAALRKKGPLLRLLGRVPTPVFLC